MEVGRIRPRLRTYFYMYFPILLAWVTCLVCGRAEGKKPQNLPTYNLTCPSGQFYTPSSHSCAPCSVCSNNDVVRKPCSQTSDTVCGPFPAFKEFQFFHQDDTKSTKEASDGEMKSDSQVSAKKTEVHLTIYRSSDNPADGSDSQHWRIVAFSLIGALSALVFVATFVVLVVWRRFNHRVTRPPTPTDDDADCPYVLIHTIRPSCSSDDEVVYQVPPGPNALHQLARQRQRLFKYRPKRRLLPANEYADDVFESEDSAGSRRRTSLQAIPETGHSDTEAECSPASSQCPSSPADQRTQSSGSSGKAQSSGFSGHTQSSGSSTKAQSSGSSGQAQSSGSIEQTQSPGSSGLSQSSGSSAQAHSSGSSGQAQSSGSMEQTQSPGSLGQTQSSGSSGQAQAFEFKDLLAGLSETVDPTTSSPVSSSACIVSGLRVTPQVESEHTDPPPPVCMESPRPAPSSGEALCV